MRTKLRRHVAAGSLLLTAVLGAGCGGSGSSGGNNPTGPSPMLLFTPDRAAAANSVTLRSGAGSTATALELEVFATGLADVQTMDFTVSFPANLLQFDGAVLGDFLGGGATLIVQPAGAGAVTLLMTRPGQGGATGSGVVVTLDFRAIAGGEGRLEFVDPEAADPFGLEIAGIDWIGGTVQIVS